MEEIHAKALTRVYNKKRLKGQKANLWIGGLKPKFSTSKEYPCGMCGMLSYFADENDMIADDHLKVCPLCAIQYIIIPPDVEKRLLETVKKDLEDEDFGETLQDS